MSRKNKYGLDSYTYAKLYSVWKNMILRCYEPQSKSYESYGARGISVCQEWRDSFEAFSDWAIENGWEPGLTIERRDVNGGYYPWNCSFVTKRQQSYNLQNSIYITMDGVEKSLPEWCDVLGIKYGMAANRIKRGETDPHKIFFNGNTRDYGRRIVQLTVGGDVVHIYRNAKEAADAIGISLSSIHNCCKGRCLTSGGYVWQYKFIKE